MKRTRRLAFAVLLVSLGVGGLARDAKAGVEITSTTLSADTPNNGATSIATELDRPVNLIASVRPPSGAGSVRFQDGDVAIGGCGAQPLDTSGYSVCVATFATVGVHNVTASYSGSESSQPSSSPVFKVVVRLRASGMQTQEAVVAVPELVRVSAHLYVIYDDGAPLPGKRVRFMKYAYPYDTPLCSAITDARGVARCSAALSGATDVMMSGYYAIFDGDSRYSGSAANVGPGLTYPYIPIPSLP